MSDMFNLYKFENMLYDGVDRKGSKGFSGNVV